MTIANKDFKVRNGIYVTGNAVIGGTATVAEPTLAAHAATKSYVDSIAIPVTGSTVPATPISGQLWLDTTESRLKVYDGSEWIILANMNDAMQLPDHIHDTSIDGDGRIVTIFTDGGTPFGAAVADGGDPTITIWEGTWSGGIATDNFN